MQWHQADFRLRELGVNVVIVTFEGRDAASAYARETRLSYPILLDESRTLYRAYGLRTAAVRHLIGPTTLKAYAREALRGVWPKWPVADGAQQGADVLIDPEGIVRFHHSGKGSGYRPPIDVILHAVTMPADPPSASRQLEA